MTDNRLLSNSVLTSEQLDASRVGFKRHGFMRLEGVLRVDGKIVYRCGHTSHAVAFEAKDCVAHASGHYRHFGRKLGIFGPWSPEVSE